MTASTVADNQTQVQIKIFEQAGTVLGEELSENKPVLNGDGLIKNLPPKPKGEVKIAVELTIDEDGLLRVRATEDSTRQELTIEVVVGMTDAEVDWAAETISAISVSS